MCLLLHKDMHIIIKLNTICIQRISSVRRVNKDPLKNILIYDNKFEQKNNECKAVEQSNKKRKVLHFAHKKPAKTLLKF